MAIWLDRQRWLSSRDYLAMGLIRDLLKENPKEFHKFAWSNHLAGYTRCNDSEELFSVEQLQLSRNEFFRDLIFVIQERGLRTSDIKSILEVGCSLGYLLRYLELNVFTDCSEIVGVDIDKGAIGKGKAHLGKTGSKVRLIHGDMENLDRSLGPQSFDLLFAAGVLSYLNERDATVVVATMLGRTKKILAFAGLAASDRDNNRLVHSILSPNHEQQWIHNFEAMISLAGGRIIKSRCERGRFCFVYAEQS